MRVLRKFGILHSMDPINSNSTLVEIKELIETRAPLR